MFVDELREYLETQKARDIKCFKRVDSRLESDNVSDILFRDKIIFCDGEIEERTEEITLIFKKYFSGLFCGILCKKAFGKFFRKRYVRECLTDIRFVAFLVQSNLIRRVINLDYDSKGEIKLRLFWAMLCFLEYQKKNK